ncbi:MAG: hypothetical protein R3B90_04080 [Planctomycetaceae bacterium]
MRTEQRLQHLIAPPAARVLSAITTGGVTLSIGLAIADVIPPDLSSLVALGVCGLLLLTGGLLLPVNPRRRTASPLPPKLQLWLAGPFLAGCAWAPASDVGTFVGLVLLTAFALTAQLARPAIADLLANRTGSVDPQPPTGSRPSLPHHASARDRPAGSARHSGRPDCSRRRCTATHHRRTGASIRRRGHARSHGDP